MSTIALDIIEQTSDRNLKPDSTPIMKFNPTNHTLSNIVSGLTLKIGLGKIDECLNDLLSTAVRTRIGLETSEKIYWNATSAHQWINLPTIADYEDLENLYDVEEVESLLYQASAKFSW